MTRIRIINGIYGYRKQKGDRSYLIPTQKGDAPIAVDDDEARRLVAEGIAEYADAIPHTHTHAEEPPEMPQDAPETSEGSNTAIDETDASEGDSEPELADMLKGYTLGQLRGMADETGIDTTGLRTKADYIAALLADADAPKLTAEEVVDA